MSAAARDSADHAEGTFEGVRGTALYEQRWRPPGGVRAAVVLMHGLKDHGSRYGELAARLVARGCAVHAFDLRGHGRSAGARVWVDRFDDYLEDLERFVARVREREPGAPLFLFGHSMGGAIVTLYTITRQPPLAGLIVHAGALAPGASGAKIAATRLVAALLPRAGVFQLDLALFSRDPAVVAAGKADPLVHQKPASAHTAREVLGAIARIEQHRAEVKVPLLALHGTGDRVTPPEGTEALHRDAASADKTLKLYPGLYHDLVHEPEKETVIADIVSWIDARAAR